MTRRRDLMCEDLFGCDHQPTIPVSRDGEIFEWTCGCGARSYSVPAQATQPSKEPT